MRKIVLIILVSLSINACRENSKTNTFISKSKISFKDLDIMKSKPKSEIEAYLMKCNYNLLDTQFSNQWKSKENDDIVQFNDKGVLVFLTYDYKTFEKIVIDLKKSTYKYFGKSMKNSLEVETYSKNKETIFISTMINPEDGKKVYSLTFI